MTPDRIMDFTLSAIESNRNGAPLHHAIRMAMRDAAAEARQEAYTRCAELARKRMISMTCEPGDHGNNAAVIAIVRMIEAERDREGR